MRTVKEFKDAGLVFVDGDMKTSPIEGEQPMMLLGGDVVIANNHPSTDIVIEFAWRANTGEMPSYKGLVEITYNGEGCEMKEVRNADSINWLNVNEWRPVISKEDKMEGKTNDPRANERVEIPECAPTYTKEMHEAECQSILGMRYSDGGGEECELIGENNQCGVFVGKPILEHDAKYLSVWPKEDCRPIGTKEMHDAGEFKNGDKVYYQHLPDRQYTFIGKHPGGSGEYSVCYCNGNVATIMTKYLSAKPIDTRTDEERLIDEVYDQIMNEGGATLPKKGIIKAMIGMGYRKP